MSKRHNPDHLAELRLPMESDGGDLVRAFIREAALADGVSPTISSLIAADAQETWQALCQSGASRERAAVVLSSSRREVRARIQLKGHSRFSAIVASLGDRVRRDAGLSYRERGVDGWEITVHRGLDPSNEPVGPIAEPTAEAAAPTDTVRIDLPQERELGGDRALFPRGLRT